MPSDKRPAPDDSAESHATSRAAAVTVVAANPQRPAAASPDSRVSRVVSRSAAADTDQLRRRVFSQTDLSAYRFKERLMIRAADLLFYLLIRGIGATMRWEARGEKHLEAIYAGGHRAIFTFWHSCIFMGTWFWRRRGIVVMSSHSRDAEYTSRFIKRFGFGTARGSASRGSGRALAEMAECLLNGLDVAFTIDGPRGPAYVAKPGAVTLARHTGQAILPFHVAITRYWALPSWDGLQVPKPFARARVFIGEPIYVSRLANKDEIAAKQEALQQCLTGLRAEGEEWRKSS